MGKSFNILVSTGAFKDVFTPTEACEMLRGVIKTATEDKKNITIRMLPMVDGGEYSNDVLSANIKCEKVEVPDVIDPRGAAITSHYLLLNDNTVFIGSSQILRLAPEFDSCKNPLILTSYGLGQLVKDAVNRKFKRIIIGLGGTSTVDGGIGMAQALDVEFLGNGGTPLVPCNGKYLTGSDLSEVSDIVTDSICPAYKERSITILCDSRINVRQMYVPTDQKISSHFDEQRAYINNTLERSLLKYCKVVERKLTDEMEHSDSCGMLDQQEGFGVAGGVNLSLSFLFKLNLVVGVEFFAQKFGLEEAVKSSDLVVTGEGRFDITLQGKTPAGISRLAKKHNKPVLFLCGNVAPELKEYFNRCPSYDLPEEIRDSGITAVISCHKYYESVQMPRSYQEKVKIYRKKTPEILSEALPLYFRQQW